MSGITIGTVCIERSVASGAFDIRDNTSTANQVSSFAVDSFREGRGFQGWYSYTPGDSTITIVNPAPRQALRVSLKVVLNMTSEANARFGCRLYPLLNGSRIQHGGVDLFIGDAYIRDTSGDNEDSMHPELDIPIDINDGDVLGMEIEQTSGSSAAGTQVLGLVNSYIKFISEDPAY